MTKLEFIDKINDILIGLNTAESDALGSLYDELMRDKNWQHYRIQAAIAAMQSYISDGERMALVSKKFDYDDKIISNFIAEGAVMYADALIAELQKPVKKKGE